MAAVDLTGIVKWSTGKPRFIDFGGELTPGLGGPVQRINRLGNRFGIDCAGVPVPEEPDGRILVATLRLAKQQGALFPWPQRSLVIGSPGSPVVNGAVTSGTSVPIRGLTVGYTIRFGQFFSIITGGWRYLYSHAAADVVADGSGHATVTVDPMLRASLANSDTVEIAQPMIQGLLASGDLDWEIMLGPHTRIDFNISEQK